MQVGYEDLCTANLIWILRARKALIQMKTGNVVENDDDKVVANQNGLIGKIDNDNGDDDYEV